MMMMKFMCVLLQLGELAPLRIPFAFAAAATFHVEYVVPFGYLDRRGRVLGRRLAQSQMTIT